MAEWWIWFWWCHKRHHWQSSRGPLAKRYGSCLKVMLIRFIKYGKYRAEAMACTVLEKTKCRAPTKTIRLRVTRCKIATADWMSITSKQELVTIDYFTSASMQESLETDDHSYAGKMKEWLLRQAPSQLRVPLSTLESLGPGSLFTPP